MLNRDIVYKYNFCNKYSSIIFDYLSAFKYVKAIKAL